MISVEPRVTKIMNEDAIQAYPDECCGFLFGKEENGDRIITDVLIVNNASSENRRRRFEIAPADYLKAEQLAIEKNNALLGVYHSHPDHPAIPSEHDRVSAQPYFSYIILSVKKQEIVSMRSWLLNDENKFEEEVIKEHHFTN